ncbi:hypothetical protein GCM10008967_38860 [Bacillus carboniphilus]|uniref:ATP-grasp domain-containing protein n=1 Tax=Bacillus carboniphilus TaxID=86663 RepID=A0ABN0WR63_9BACI
MKFVTFNPYRTIGIQDVTYIKPENMYRELDTVLEADVVLFPEYWQVNTLVYGLKKRIFPSIETYQIGHTKVEQTRVFQGIFPEHVPYTLIKGSAADIDRDIFDEMPVPFIAKEIRNSMGQGVHLIHDKQDFLQYAVNNDVWYVQEYLPIMKDLRIVWVGNKVIEAYWRVNQGHDFLTNVSQGGIISYENIPMEAIQLVEKAATTLNIDHAGFDIAQVGEKLYFFEINVMFGNQGIRDRQYTDAILEYLLGERPIILPA